MVVGFSRGEEEPMRRRRADLVAVVRLDLRHERDREQRVKRRWWWTCCDVGSSSEDGDENV